MTGSIYFEPPLSALSISLFTVTLKRGVQIKQPPVKLYYNLSRSIVFLAIYFVISNCNCNNYCIVRYTLSLYNTTIPFIKYRTKPIYLFFILFWTFKDTYILQLLANILSLFCMLLFYFYFFIKFTILVWWMNF